MLPLRRYTILLDACALTSTVSLAFTIEIEIESNEFFDCTFATRRIKFNESSDRPDCVSWHILVTQLIRAEFLLFCPRIYMYV